MFEDKYTAPSGMVPTNWTKCDEMIKVIGVGGGGCNAVTHMKDSGITGCNFIVCNTDSQALEKSSVVNKIQLGEGLGAGTDPVAGRNAAIEGMKLLEDAIVSPKTQMVFVTAGMGGGTGTGAAPVIAKIAKDHGYLTIGVVTIPFKHDTGALGKAVDGVNELSKVVDSLLIINNEKLYEHYGTELIRDAFPRANEVLATAVRAIVEVIKKYGYINVDFKDVAKMMRNSGMALMGCGEGQGPDRVDQALQNAFNCPLLNDFDLKTAKDVLVNITTSNSDQGLKMEELKLLDEKIAAYTGDANHFKKGIIYDTDENAPDKIKVTAIVTGFEMGKLGDITDVNLGKVIMLDKDFVYKRQESEGECVKIEKKPIIHKVSYSTGVCAPKFSFTEKPCLSVEETDNIGVLESQSAFRRRNNAKS